MRNLFKIVPSNFFSVLSSPNRYIYVDCLFIIYESIDSIEDAFSGEREFIVQKLIDYFDEIDEELKDHFDANTSRQRAVAVINVLKSTGWIGEEELGNYKTSLNFFDYSIKVLETLRSIRDNEQLLYSGEIYAIYSLLSSFTIPEGVGILEQAHQKTNSILLKLKALKANIYRFYYSVTHNSGKDELSNLLELLLVDYKENFFDSAYYKLKTTDALPRYKKAILTKVAAIYNDAETLEALVDDVIKLKKISYDEAFSYVEKTIRYIRDCFDGMEKLIDAIDRKNEQYIQAVSAKIMFLTNHSDDLEGIMNRLFKILMEAPDDFNYSQIFNLVNIRNMDVDSLYSPRRARFDPIIDVIDDNFDLDEDEFHTAFNRVISPKFISKEKVNEFVLDKLKDKDVINADELPLNDREDIMRLVLIFLYSRSTNIDYDIQMLEKDVKVSNITFRNFMIFRKD